MADPFATVCTECDPCRLHVAKLDAAMAGIMDILHAERESHAAQVSAMLEERDQLQGMVEIAKATLVYKEAMAAALGAPTASPSWGAARNAADILDATIARVRP